MVMQIIILAALLFVIPVAAGGIFAGIHECAQGIFFRWVSGQMCLWAGFQLICVPLILREKHFSEVAGLFWVYMAAVMILAAGMELKRGIKGRNTDGRHQQRGKNFSFAGMMRNIKAEKLVALAEWIIVFGLLLYQLMQTVRLSYADGDDAFYLAVSAAAHKSDVMYLTNPYTGLSTGVDMRHALAPFPVWISFLAQVSGMHAAIVAKTVLPVVLICMTYAIFYLLSLRLFPERGERRPLFMIFAQLLVLFGNYSIYTAENFMLARSRQGKAAFGSIVIPFVLLLFLLLLQRLEAGGKIQGFLYLMFGAAAVTGCLCSTLGSLILCMIVGIVGILGALCYKRFDVLLPLAGSCIPCVCYAAIYLILG